MEPDFQQLLRLSGEKPDSSYLVTAGNMLHNYAPLFISSLFFETGSYVARAAGAWSAGYSDLELFPRLLLLSADLTAGKHHTHVLFFHSSCHDFIGQFLFPCSI